MNYDCIIIGAGFSGIAAGIRLAHFGKKVCIVEQHSKIGGLNSYYNRLSYGFESGLHAMTNYVTQDASKSSHLLRLLRYLRIPYEDFMLREQNHSLIKFPGKTIRFNNNILDLEKSVREAFPSEIDNFRNFNKAIDAAEDFDFNSGFEPSLPFMKKYLKDPMLIDMLRCPIMFYGSATENDMDLTQFIILYKSVFFQGLCRPAGDGIRTILSILKERFLNEGGELKLNTKVSKINVRDNHVKSIITDKGEELSASSVLSSAGYPETLNLCDVPSQEKPKEGKMAFIETVAVMGDALNKYKDLKDTIIFYSSTDDLRFKAPDSLVNADTGIICFPHNFQFKADDKVPEKSIRISAPANPAMWMNIEEGFYRKTKETEAAKLFKKAEEVTGVRNILEDSLLIDTMTPKTITRYTGRINGAIYGCPLKVKNGKTHLDNLFICGTDQGLLGITGSMLSGINIASMYLMK